MNEQDRVRQVAERRAQMPKTYRGIYDKAMSGKSRKAAMRAFCLECVGWQIKEVHLCTDRACPLFPYRPTSRSSQGAPQDSAEPPESPKDRQRGPVWTTEKGAADDCC